MSAKKQTFEQQIARLEETEKQEAGYGKGKKEL